MYIGIDVGGTCTDSVLMEKGLVKNWVKVPTKTDLLATLLEALDGVLQWTPPDMITRVALSTTMITNLIVEKKYDPVGLILIPGPGLKLDYYLHYSSNTQIISGVIDYRGREIVPLDLVEVDKAISALAADGYQKVAVIGKFSCRNNCQELQIAEIIRSRYSNWQVELGHKAAGQLNYPRRIVSTLLTCATREKYQFFLESVQQALKQRQINCPVYILKADGGTLPLQQSKSRPIETIFSGPAASTLGVQALLPPGETAGAVDIGGTTSELALIISGKPLLDSKGAKVNDWPTQVRALAVKSVPVGGDSLVGRAGQEIIIYSYRKGSPCCLGGTSPTPTDALRILGLSRIGNYDLAWKALQELGQPLNLNPVEVAFKIINKVTVLIAREIDLMYKQWEQHPVYRVWEVLQKRKIRPPFIVGVGGGAAGFITAIAAQIGSSPVIPPYARIANAIGAALARPTLQVTMRADTQQRIYSILEEGYQDKLEEGYFDEVAALKLTREWLDERCRLSGLEMTDELGEPEIIRKEVFNIVRDWSTVGRLYDIIMQTQRGILHYVGTGDEKNDQKQ
ncbi:MAG: hydantoinase/oxoprolinase family protein [Clostridia bacterium]|nr:hydantoinase/oxoprolinase family protein [Clostridia bacterium]